MFSWAQLKPSFNCFARIFFFSSLEKGRGKKGEIAILRRWGVDIKLYHLIYTGNLTSDLKSGYESNLLRWRWIPVWSFEDQAITPFHPFQIGVTLLRWYVQSIVLLFIRAHSFNDKPSTKLNRLSEWRVLWYSRVLEICMQSEHGYTAILNRIKTANILINLKSTFNSKKKKKESPPTTYHLIKTPSKMLPLMTRIKLDTQRLALPIRVHQSHNQHIFLWIDTSIVA